MWGVFGMWARGCSPENSGSFQRALMAFHRDNLSLTNKEVLKLLPKAKKGFQLCKKAKEALEACQSEAFKMRMTGKGNPRYLLQKYQRLEDEWARLEFLYGVFKHYGDGAVVMNGIVMSVQDTKEHRYPDVRPYGKDIPRTAEYHKIEQPKSPDAVCVTKCILHPMGEGDYRDNIVVELMFPTIEEAKQEAIKFVAGKSTLATPEKFKVAEVVKKIREEHSCNTSRITFFIETDDPETTNALGEQRQEVLLDLRAKDVIIGSQPSDGKGKRIINLSNKRKLLYCYYEDEAK